MRTETAKTLDEIRHVKEFTDGDTWAHARKFLARAPKDPFADHYRWIADDAPAPVAGVQVFLHQYPIGRATLGMCLPKYPFVPPELRGRGHFKRLMADLFAWCAASGYPLAYSHGRKGLYTGIGYAPCLHHCAVLLRVPDARALDLASAVRQLLPELDAHRRAAAQSIDFPDAIRLATEDQEVALDLTDGVSISQGAGDAPRVVLPRKAMVRMIMGYAMPTELAVLHEGCVIPPEWATAVNALAPTWEPHLIHENTAFAGPAALGLVP